MARQHPRPFLPPPTSPRPAVDDAHGNLFNASAPQISLYDKDNKLHHIDYLGRELVTEPDGTLRYFQHEIKSVNGTNYIEFEGRKYNVNPR